MRDRAPEEPHELRQHARVSSAHAESRQLIEAARRGSTCLTLSGVSVGQGGRSGGAAVRSVLQRHRRRERK